MKDSSEDDLIQAANALERHNETEAAENIKAYIDERMGIRHKILTILKTIIGYVLTASILLIGIVGAFDYALSGEYINALYTIGLSLVGYLILALIEKAVSKIGDWIDDDINNSSENVIP